MIIDYTYFGYGVGLVIVGFLAGLFVNAVANTWRSIR